MSNKSTTFTLEIKGLELQEKEHAEISKALNDTLMHHLGKLDRSGSGASADAATPKANGNSGYLFSEYLINGGRLEYIMSQQLNETIRGLENGLKGIGGIQIMPVTTAF